MCMFVPRHAGQATPYHSGARQRGYIAGSGGGGGGMLFHFGGATTRSQAQGEVARHIWAGPRWRRRFPIMIARPVGVSTGCRRHVSAPLLRTAYCDDRNQLRPPAAARECKQPAAAMATLAHTRLLTFGFHRLARRAFHSVTSIMIQERNQLMNLFVFSTGLKRRCPRMD